MTICNRECEWRKGGRALHCVRSGIIENMMMVRRIGKAVAGRQAATLKALREVQMIAAG
jgi:hypothetical protein